MTSMTSNIAHAQPSSVSAESVFDWADPLLLDDALSEDLGDGLTADQPPYPERDRDTQRSPDRRNQAG